LESSVDHHIHHYYSISVDIHYHHIDELWSRKDIHYQLALLYEVVDYIIIWSGWLYYYIDYEVDCIVLSNDVCCQLEGWRWCFTIETG